MSTAADDTAVEKQNWHWRNSMRPVRFFNLDARAGLPFFILLFYFRVITIVFTLTITFTFWFLERKGMTFPSAMRGFRVWFIGLDRPGWLTFRRRVMRDYG